MNRTCSATELPWGRQPAARVRRPSEERSVPTDLGVPLLTLVLIGLVGGLITGISPCVLPVLPVLFFTGGDTGTATSGETAQSRTRPYLIVAGLTISFSVFTLLGTLIVSALPLPDDTIRWAGLVLLVLLGLAMIVPRVQDLLERPFARIGRRQAARVKPGGGALLLGLALGAVYVPCAGPVLAAITVAGATGQIGVRTVALTVAFGVGTAVPLLFFALAGRTVAERVRAFRDRQRGVRITAGVVVIALAVALTFNLTDVLTRVPGYTDHIEQSLGQIKLGPEQPIDACASMPVSQLQNCGPAPQLTGLTDWENSAPLTTAGLKGKVVLVDFWAYSCINCQRAIPHVEAWYQRYAADGLVVVGVHTPEYAFEHEASNVAAGAKRLHITYPVALDNGYKTWNAFRNNSWPADYLIDATGRVRHATIGEGDYGGTEQLIRQLLKAAHPNQTLPAPTDLPDTTPTNPDQTPETYLGSERTSGDVAAGTDHYTFPSTLAPDTYALSGTWTLTPQYLKAGADARMELNFDASDVYLDVAGTGTVTATYGGRTTTIKVSGAPNIYPVVDTDSVRRGVVSLSLSPGLQAYSFTFG